MKADDQVLLLLPAPVELALVQSTLTSAGLRCRSCASAQELYQHLEQTGAAVVSQEALTAPVMTRLVQTLDSKEGRRDYPFVLLFDSPGTTASEAIRLLDLLEPFGNLTVLERPLRPLALVSAVRTAARSQSCLERAQEQVHLLLEEVRQRDQRLASLVHRMRTPLSTILMAVEVLDQFGTLTSPAAEQRALVRRQTLLLARLLGDYQEPREAIWADVTLRRQPVDLMALGQRLAHRTEGSLKPRQQLSLNLASKPVWVTGDPARLEEVLTTLLHHAVEQADPGGEIRVEVQAESGKALCRVRGPGKTPGSGQVWHENPALQRARQLVAMHGGSLRSSLGDKVELDLRLPLGEAPAPGEGEVQTALRSSVPSRLLLVEDDEECREALQFVLRLQGVEVDVAGDGRQGLQMALDHSPEVVLLDIDLPGLDGFEVARRIRNRLGNDVRLVALTGLGRESDRRKAMQAGFDDCLVKPVTLQELFRAVAVCGRAE